MTLFTQNFIYMYLNQIPPSTFRTWIPLRHHGLWYYYRVGPEYGTHRCISLEIFSCILGNYGMEESSRQLSGLLLEIFRFDFGSFV